MPHQVDLLRSAFDGKIFFPINRVDHASAVSFPLVSVFDIIDAQASLHILFHHLIP